MILEPTTLMAPRFALRKLRPTSLFSADASTSRPMFDGAVNASRTGTERLPPGETFRPYQVSETHLGIDEYDVAHQGLVSHHFRAVGGRFE
jgi:hypothetical protein